MLAQNGTSIADIRAGPPHGLAQALQRTLWKIAALSDSVVGPWQTWRRVTLMSALGGRRISSRQMSAIDP